MTTNATSVADNIARIQQQLQQAATTAKRNPHSVRLIAVSKTKPTALIEQAYQAGQRDFGENYVQEGVDKVQQLAELTDICWHFIGPLQSNKTKDVAAHFDWVQSIDRLKIARRLSDQRSPELPPLQVLIQVNIDDETTKSGVSEAELMPLAEAIDALPNLELRGLMAIPAPAANSGQPTSFAAMHGLFLKLQAQYKQVDTLSMGMSDDMVAAIEHGSTMVRIGTAIFGARSA
ncbi:MAG: YggS family pyridoxal phosphate-dependent enzyme [Idiomarina sp.]